MAQLIVRNVDDVIVRQLKRRAAEHGRSAEAEHREILRQVLLEKPPGHAFKELLAAVPDVGQDSDFARTPDAPRRVSL